MTSIIKPQYYQQRRPSFSHVVLTRFNVRLNEDLTIPSIGTDLNWLAERFQLFEHFCLPSVLSQIEQNFTWIIFFDSATPEPFATRARELALQRNNLIPIFSPTLPMSRIKESIQEALPVSPEWLMTTRLDNDDGLHQDYVMTVQRMQRFEGSEVLNCPIGIILRKDRAYLRRDISNAFISLSEPYLNFETIYSVRHRQAGNSFALRQGSRSPLWLQVVHDNNISNRVRGWRVTYASAARAFPAIIDPKTGPMRESMVEMLAENLTLSVMRSLRDYGVMVARNVARWFGIDLVRKPNTIRNRPTGGNPQSPTRH
jgi:hypothetical protein